MLLLLVAAAGAAAGAAAAVTIPVKWPLGIFSCSFRCLSQNLGIL
jgi:hypothetical protein